MSSVFPITTERPFIKHYVAAMFAYFPNNNDWGIITTSSSGCLQFPLQMLFCCRGWIFVTLVSNNSWVQLAGETQYGLCAVGAANTSVLFLCSRWSEAEYILKEAPESDPLTTRRALSENSSQRDGQSFSL